MKNTFVVLAAAALVMSSQAMALELDWNKDVVAQMRQASAHERVETASPIGRPASQQASAGRIEGEGTVLLGKKAKKYFAIKIEGAQTAGVYASGSKDCALIDGEWTSNCFATRKAEGAMGQDHVVVEFNNCPEGDMYGADGSVNDCDVAVVPFTQLTVDAAGQAVRIGSEKVGSIHGSDVKLVDGYKLVPQEETTVVRRERMDYPGCTLDSVSGTWSGNCSTGVPTGKFDSVSQDTLKIVLSK